MTPPMPTDETPSAGAMVATIRSRHSQHPQGVGTCETCELLIALDAFAREQAHWQCDLCHCCGEKRHDGGDPCVSCESTAREREAAVWEEAAKEIPSSWLDPLLSGPTTVLTGHANWGCPDIERLLWELSKRLSARAAEARRTP